ncbi:class 3 adenylate cyclase [Roseovarius sp. MBR-154]
MAFLRTGPIIDGQTDVTDNAGEKRWVASLMLDLVDSTGITEALGVERAFAMFEDVLETAVEIIESHGGHFIEYAGDSVFVLFGAPVAVENATLSAGRAALQILDRLGTRNAEIAVTCGVEPRVRIGLAAGEVLVSETRFSGQSRVNALGSAVNLAARLQSVATPNEVWCSEAVADELSGLAEIEDCGTYSLKGFKTPQRLFRVHRIRSTEDSLDIRIARNSGVFVGRAEPLARLTRWLQGRAGDDGALWVSGPAGIGKSRLVRQALGHLPDGVAVHYGKCRAADQASPLRPVLGLLRAAARHDGVMATPDFAPWLTDLTGAADAGLIRLLTGGQTLETAHDRDADQDTGEAVRTRRHIAQAVRRLACDPARRLVIEDMHWIDPVSREVLHEMLDEAPPELRLLTTSRDSAPHQPPWDEARLAPLTEADVTRMLEVAQPEIADKSAVARVIFRQSEGNPLFAEELMRHIGANGAGTLDALPRASGIGMIQNLIFSRFDTLPAPDKAFLRQAAILGREVRPAWLDRIATGDTPLEAILSRAAEMHLVDRVQPGQALRFSHVLFQNAIRDSITDSQACELHRHAGEILLAADARDESDDLTPDLAYHFDRAGDWRRAALYNVHAAQAAWRVYALDVCLDHLDRADAALDSGGADAMTDVVFADFVTIFCRVLDVAGRWSKLSDVAARHLPRLQGQAQDHAYLVVLMLNAKAFNQQGCLIEAEQAITDTLTLAEQTGDANALAMARTVRMDILNDGPDGARREDLQRLFEETRAYAHSGADPHMAQMRLYEMAAFWRQDGEVPRARALAAEILAYGREHDDVRARAFGGWIMASITAMVEEYEATRGFAAEAMRNAIPGTMDYTTAQAFHAGATLMLGTPAMTAEELRRLSDTRLDAGDTTMAIIAVFYAAGSLFSQGRIREALGALARTDALVRSGCEWGLRQQYLIKRAESFLTVAGLLPAPLPQPRLALHELPAAVRLRLKAKALASAAYDELERDFDGGHGLHGARVDFGRGLLAGRKGRDRIRRALDVFRAQEVPALVELAQKVL